MHNHRARAVSDRSSAPASILPSRPCPPIPSVAKDLQRNDHRHATVASIARLFMRRVLVGFVTVAAAFMYDAADTALPKSNARVQTAARSEAADRFQHLIDDASGRFAVPASWIRAVMHVESGADPHATSPRGALGLMQLMPATWVELSVRYGLGVDPFDARDNIIAGTAYLKEMYDRFGSAGFLAAYHSGPARYEQHLATGRPLPQETTAYVAAVMPLLADHHSERTAVRIRRVVPWREAPLFVERAGAP